MRHFDDGGVRLVAAALHRLQVAIDHGERQEGGANIWPEARLQGACLRQMIAGAATHLGQRRAQGRIVGAADDILPVEADSIQ